MKEKYLRKLVRKNVALVILLLMLNNVLLGDQLIRMKNGETARITNAPNGVPMIELSNPGKSGISVNNFENLSVDEKNLILNNISAQDGSIYRSELGGLITPNSNYDGAAARAVLIRVSNDPSIIGGFIEAASVRNMDMIFANERGIVLNGGLVGRFGNVMFTTGRVSDDLMSVMVRDGRIEIGASGFNAKTAQNLGILAREIKINGQLNNDNEISLVAGEYDYDTATKSITKKGNNPGEVLISASAVGSIYSRQIYLVAVGSDIGVKSDVIGDRVSINADGTITINKAQGTKSIDVKGKNFTQEGSMYTEGNLTIDAEKTVLNGAGTQAQNINISGKLENNTNIYADSDLIVGNDTINKGKIITEKSLTINGTVDSDNLIYAKDEVKISGDLKNTNEVQSEENINIGGNTTNTGKIITSKDLDIKGKLDNSGTAYGESIKVGNDLNNAGNVQSTGELTVSGNTKNDGKILTESNFNTKNLENTNEIIAGKNITTNSIDNKTGAKLSVGESLTADGNVNNQGIVKVTDDFNISGDLQNNNEMAVGGNLDTKAITNTGNLKTAGKITGRGVFTNSGEILTSNLDIETTGVITNTNKINVIENSKLKASSINNGGILTSENIELLTPTLVNTGSILADEQIKINNTNLNNTGTIASNDKIELNNSNVINRNKIESSEVVLLNLSSYDNTGLIRGNNISLSTLGSLNLQGTLLGIDNLFISGLDIANNGQLNSAGILNLTGRDITNNTTISAQTVQLISSGNILNSGLVEGETGTLRGQNITNTDLIMFLDNLDIEGTKLINTNASIYSDDVLNIRTADVDNIDGEIVGQQTLNITGFNLLDNTRGIIDSRGNILLSGNKLLNGGEVSGKYRLYWTTWDGQNIYEDTWRELNDDYMQKGGKIFDKTLHDIITGKTWDVYKDWEFTALDDWEFGISKSAMMGGVNRRKEFDKIRNSQDYPLYFANLGDGQLNDTGKKYETKVLEGKVDTSQLVTSGGRILSGGNLTLDVVELENKNSKISAGGTLLITDKVQKIANTTDAMTVKVYDGNERVSIWETMWTHGNGDTEFAPAISVGRFLTSDVRDYNIADGVSVIEGNNVIIQGTPTINNGYDYSAVKTGVTEDPSTITTKDVDINLYYDPVTVHVDNTEIAAVVRDGVIPFSPNMFNDTISKLFTQSKDPLSKYLIETRSQYIDLSKFYGSDYFLDRLGYNEANEWNRARRLGDSYYETKYLNTVIFETLGTRFINGKTDVALIKDLLDNGVETSKNLQLSLGVELTKEQVAALKSDIIWYVEKEVNGEKVLVPQVYLSQTTLATMKNPTTTISAQETLVMNSGDLLNQGRIEGKAVYVNASNVINKSVGELRAEILGDNILINSSKDILNIGATIGAKENLNLIATGDIVNITTGDKTKVTDSINGRKRTNESDSIQSTGLISAGENTVIMGNNYISRGAITESGDTTYIQADNEVKITTINLKETQTEKIKYGHESYEINQKIGSEVTGVGNVVIDAKNINIKGSSVMSDGVVQMTAVNDINIVNDKDTMYTETIKNKKGTFSSYSLDEKDYKEGAVASTIVGNNVILDAGNNINVRASNIVAVKDGIENIGGNIIIGAGNDINITADTLNNYHSKKEKKSGFSADFSNSGGGLSAGVSYSKNSLEQSSNNTVVAVSTLMSDGSTVLDAGNKVRTEAMQANIGEDLIIRGVNGVELLDAKETYEEKTKQKSSTIGITASVGSTVTSFVSSADDVLGNNGKYGFDNKSQLINSYGDGLGLYRDTVKAGADLSQAVVDGMKGTLGNALSDPTNLANYGISANVSLNISKSSYESNTSGTRSVAGEINVGGNMIVESEGDVRFVNQKINVGDNLIIDAKSFEASAGKNTYSNDTKSSSSGANVGYDIIGNTVTGGINGSKGNSNTSSTSYDNTVINAGGTFQLVTKEDATFKGANVTADKINFDIGGNLNIVSLQDEYYTHGKNTSAGVNYGHNDVRNAANEMEGYNSVGGDMSYGQTNGDAKWVSDQTSIIATNGGNIKVNETLTNIGAIIGSINEPLNIDTKKLVTEDLKDYNNGENYNVGLSGIDRKNAVPETAIQYGSENKEQDTNATFSNVVVTENGTKVDLEERGINTDIEKAQVITKDEKVDQIDTKLGTDLINKGKREELINDTKLFGENVTIISNEIKETYNKVVNSFKENDLEKMSDSDINIFLTTEVLGGINYELDPESRKELEKIKKLANDLGLDYSILSSEQVVEEILYIRSKYPEGEQGKITSNYSTSDKSKLILLYDQLNQKDESLKLMSEKVIDKVYTQVEKSSEYKKMSLEWKEAYLNNDFEKMDTIFQKYSLKVEELFKKEYGIELNTKYTLIPQGSGKIVLGNEGKDWFIPGDNLYGMYSKVYNETFINMGYKEYGKYYFDSLEKVDERTRHENGNHNFYSHLFELDNKNANKIIKDNNLENYQKINNIFMTLPQTDTYVNRLVYLMESQEAIAKYIENYKGNLKKVKK